MWKPRSPTGATSSAATRSTTASGGAESASPESRLAIAASSPSASTSTPRASLRTCPASPSSFASRETNGRNPTPCTVPSTRTRTRPLATDQLHQHVVGARLRLLDPRDVLRARDDHEVCELLGGDLAAVVSHQRDRGESARARLAQRRDHVARP